MGLRAGLAWLLGLCPPAGVRPVPLPPTPRVGHLPFHTALRCSAHGPPAYLTGCPEPCGPELPGPKTEQAAGEQAKPPERPWPATPAAAPARSRPGQPCCWGRGARGTRALQSRAGCGERGRPGARLGLGRRTSPRCSLLGAVIGCQGSRRLTIPGAGPPQNAEPLPPGQ